MAGRLEGKRAFITGAGSGIGQATAIRFAREGARLILLDRNEDGLSQTSDSIQGETPVEVLTRTGSVALEKDVSGAVTKAAEAFGGLDIVIGVAGIELYAEGDTNVHELDLAVWQRTMDTNLTGMFLTLKHGIAALLQNGGGAAIVTGSPTGLYGFAAGETAYSASKAGCHGLARVCATEYAKDSIRVNVVVPGFIDTPINHPFMDDEAAVAEVLRGIPLGRPGQADEVAALMVWLASDDASYATGGLYMVDGGQTSV
jgi:NAD(P)-dependent dehydrogenase (short-subunit alcohol dehydrogenase family)